MAESDNKNLFDEKSKQVAIDSILVGVVTALGLLAAFGWNNGVYTFGGEIQSSIVQGFAMLVISTSLMYTVDIDI